MCFLYEGFFFDSFILEYHLIYFHELKILLKYQTIVLYAKSSLSGLVRDFDNRVNHTIRNRLIPRIKSFLLKTTNV